MMAKNRPQDFDIKRQVFDIDSTSFRPFSCSSHFLWIGERTRQYDEAHIEFIRGIHNPIGIKVSSEYEKDELLKTIQKINPYNFKMEF